MLVVILKLPDFIYFNLLSISNCSKTTVIVVKPFVFHVKKMICFGLSTFISEMGLILF